MKVLFTSEAVASEVTGKLYSTNICTHVEKYLFFGEVITCCYKKNVESTTLKPIADTKIEVFSKENSIRAFINVREENAFHMKTLVEQVDMIVAHIPSSLSTHAIRYARQYNKPYISVVVGCSWDAMWNYDWRGKLLAPFYYFKLKHLVSTSMYTLYVTKYFLQKRYPCKHHTAYASNVSINDAGNKVIERKLSAIKLKNDSKIVLATSAAVDVRYKGQDDVLKAMSILNRLDGPKYYYYLLGGGDQTYLQTIARKYGVEKYLFFLGHISHEDVLNFMDKRADIYIQPSKQEGLPRALIEAMSRGVPSLASTAAGIPELLDDKYLFKPGSVREIVDKLLWFDKEKRADAVYENYQTSLQYTKEVLNSRRNQFFQMFIRDYFPNK